ncbi:MAG: phosphoribosylformylglycinamidine synthase I [Candidatus Marinimicrobia bacterium]|nr:phosphoribosylformylglycinamidine synthase I [Candidatus Neomarinimicrobiota bacterium]|tara:strand:+ start:4328 stop:4996 length:669 start_codon:yes stop_codon:yes gene_type:complete
MKFAILVFPGSNCDHDAYKVIDSIEGAYPSFVWHKNDDLSQFDCIIVPGGFSYGDYLRAGAIAKFSPIMKSLVLEANKGKKIIGICNGFQILLESGLLEGALINNKKVKFRSKNVSLNTNNYNTPFTNAIPKNIEMVMPIAHRQGNYIASKDVLKKLEDNNQIAFTYSPLKGGNPNGSCLDVAGIFNDKKNVLGMMPHPERASDLILGSEDGLHIFKSMLEG